MARRKNKTRRPRGSIDLEGFRKLRAARQMMAVPTVWRIDFAEGVLLCGPLKVTPLSHGLFRCSFYGPRAVVDDHGSWYSEARDPNEAVARRLKVYRDHCYRLRLAAEAAELALAGGFDWSGVIAKDADDDARAKAEIEKAVKMHEREAVLIAQEDEDERKFQLLHNRIEDLKCDVEEARMEGKSSSQEAYDARRARYNVENELLELKEKTSKLRKRLRAASRPTSKKPRRKLVTA